MMQLLYNPQSIKELKFKLRRKFPEIKESDMVIINDNVVVMLSVVAYKLRKSKEQLIEIIKKL